MLLREEVLCVFECVTCFTGFAWFCMVFRVLMKSCVTGFVRFRMFSEMTV